MVCRDETRRDEGHFLLELYTLESCADPLCASELLRHELVNDRISR